MSKPIYSHLDFDFKAGLVKPLITPEEVGALAVAPTGALIFDGIGATPTSKLHVGDGTAWQSLLDERDISADTDFSLDPAKIATRDAVRQYVEATVAGVGTFKGSFDASGGAAPTGAGIMAGDYYRATVAGTLTGLEGGSTVQVGDIIVASIDNPAGNADYFALQANFTDARDVAVGGTFTPQSGTITGTSSVKDALEFLKFDITQAGAQDLQSVLDNGSNADLSLSGSIFRIRAFEAGSEVSIADNQSLLKSGNNAGFFGKSANFIARGSKNSFTDTEVIMEVRNDPGSITGFDISTDVGAIFTDSILSKGIAYSADYSNNFTARSLVDKSYVDSTVGAIKNAFTITGDGTATSFTVTHNKASKEVIVQVWEVATDELVEVAVTLTDNNNASISFATAPATATEYRVVVL